MRKPFTPFQRARLRLTGWYMLMFSGLIAGFTYLTLDAKNSAYVRVYQVINTGSPGSPQVQEFSDKYAEFNQRFKERLILFDLALLVIGGYLAYGLSGKTLQPIQKMVEEQVAFAADVSHSLRTPLTTISLEIEAYKRFRHKLPKELGNLLQSIQDEVFSVTQLVSGMLTLVRTQTDEFKTNFKQVRLHELVAEVVAKMIPLAQAKKQTIKIQQLNKTEIRGNGDSLKQVLYIILDNAIKYSGAGGRISVLLVKQKSLIRLQVADTGRGIAKKDLKKIFERYYRADKQTKGTGLGLAIATKLVAQHEGQIQVKSRVGEGTTFTITLPRDS